MSPIDDDFQATLKALGDRYAPHDAARARWRLWSEVRRRAEGLLGIDDWHDLVARLARLVVLLDAMKEGGYLDELNKAEQLLPVTKTLIDMIRANATREELDSYLLALQDQPWAREVRWDIAPRLSHCVMEEAERQIKDAMRASAKAVQDLQAPPQRPSTCDQVAFEIDSQPHPTETAPTDRSASEPASSSSRTGSTQQPHRRPAAHRPVQTDPKADANFVTDWRTSGMSLPDFAKARGMNPDDARRTRDRVRDRERSGKRRRQTRQ